MDRKRPDEEGLAPIVRINTRMMRDEMDRMFDRLRFGIEDFWWPSPIVRGPRVPRVDVKEHDGEYVVEAEVPGMTKDNVEIELGEDSIDIKARKEEEKEEKAEGYIRRERGSLSFYRRLPLPENADRDHIEAKMEDGVLRISIPKTLKHEEKKQKVEIK